MNDLIFTPEDWHACSESTYKTCTKGVNCYSYALNEPEYYWSVPGLGYAKTKAQHYFDSFKAYIKDMSLLDFREMLISGAIHDGLIQTDTPEDRDGYYSVALFFPANDFNFHWYRQDNNGMWSHKDGWKQVSNVDDGGNVIHDPREAQSASYPLLGSFYLAPRQGIVLEQTFPLL